MPEKMQELTTEQEFIAEQEYKLLSEATYLDKSGIGKKTKEVKLLAVKFEDGEKISKIVEDEGSIVKALQTLSEKGYIVPLNEEGKLLVSSLHFRTAIKLFNFYSKAFF